MAQSRARKTNACQGFSAPEASGRARVRSTAASILRSQRSFTTHPAPRMTTEPMANRSTSQSPDQKFRAPREIDHKPGRKSSQAPIGRSNRARIA